MTNQLAYQGGQQRPQRPAGLGRGQHGYVVSLLCPQALGQPCEKGGVVRHVHARAHHPRRYLAVRCGATPTRHRCRRHTDIIYIVDDTTDGPVRQGL
jgi:hypothetical protein